MSKEIGQLERFSKVLALAIADRKLEDAPKTEVLHYFDTDTVYGALNPLQDVLRADRRRNPEAMRDLVVRSMWMSGALGRVCMVWPHIIEFRKKMYEGGLRDPDERQNDLKEHRESRVYLGPLNEIISSINSTSGKDADLIRQYLEKTSDLPPSYFAALEAMVESEKDRWQRLSEQVWEEYQPGDPIPKLTSDDRFWPCATLIAAARNRDRKPGEQLEISRNTVTDAMAVISMTRIASSGGLHVRFYTSGQALAEVMRSEQLQAVLRREDLNDEDMLPLVPITNPEACLSRGSYYYLMRIIFPALRLKTALDGNGEESQYAHYSLADLERISLTVQNFLDERKQLKEDRIGELRAALTEVNEKLSGLDILELSQSIEASTLSVSIWLEHRTGAMERLASEFPQVEGLSSFAQTNERELSHVSNTRARKLERDILRGCNSLQLMSQLSERATELRSLVSPVDREQTLIEELGLYRWRLGIHQAANRFQEWLTSLLLDEQVARFAHSLSQLASRASSYPVNEQDHESVDDLTLGAVGALVLGVPEVAGRVLESIVAGDQDRWPVRFHIFAQLFRKSRVTTSDGRDPRLLSYLHKRCESEYKVNASGRADAMLALAWTGYMSWCDHWDDASHQEMVPQLSSFCLSRCGDVRRLYSGEHAWPRFMAELLQSICLATQDDSASPSLAFLAESIEGCPNAIVGHRFCQHCISVVYATLHQRGLLNENHHIQEGVSTIGHYLEGQSPFWHAVSEGWVRRQDKRLALILKQMR